ncbi:MAG: S8 family serine peptidase [Anaerolineae bacterium]|nr:S8 family serine peptidase [Anaerolineae bacterium]
MGVWISRARGAAWVMLTALTLLSISAFGAAAQTPELYYYALGEPVSLALSARFVAVGGAVAPDGGQVRALTGVFAALESEGLPLQPGIHARLNFTLLPLAGGTSERERAALVDSMRAAALPVGWVNPVFERAGSLLVLTDEFLATFPAGTPRAGIDALNAASGVEIARQISSGAAGDVYVLRVTAGAGVDALMMANHYHTGGIALHAEPNWAILATPPAVDAFEAMPTATVGAVDAPGAQFVVEPQYTPNDTYYANGWHMNNYQQFVQYRSSMVFDADIDAKEAWDTQRGSASVIIAILDDGVQTSHPDLDDKIVFPYDAIGGDNDPQPYDDDFTRDWDALGTHLAGLAAAESDNSEGITGVCHACKIMPIRIHYSYFVGANRLLFTTIEAIVAGINWAEDNGAAVLNNSWIDPNPSTTVADALRSASVNGRGGLGAVLVFAAGNSYQFLVSWPGKLASVLPGAITAGASTWCDTVKVDSVNTPESDDCTTDHGWGNNWGTEIGLSAPGHFLPSTDLTGTDGYVDGDYTGNIGGTSVVAPIVAGAAGLVLSQNPGFTNDQVRDRLLTSTDPLHTAGYDTASGWGRLNVQKAVTNTITNTGTPNDHRDSAVSITTLPYSTSQTVLGAFTDRTDPALACLTSSQLVSNTVWFKFTPAYTMTVNAFTFGYNTVMGVYDPAMTSVACNNDVAPGVTWSQFSFVAVAGTTYSFLVGDLTPVSNPDGSSPPAQLIFSLSTTTPPPTGSLNGSVVLEGRPAPPDPVWSVPLHVVVKPTSGGAAAFDGMITTGLSGEFIVSNLAVGEYNIWAKGTHTLANMVTATIAGETPVSVGTLKEGDANDDNAVGIGDFSILAAAFGSAQGGANYDARADFNTDGAVNIADFSLLAANFSQSGVAQP